MWLVAMAGVAMPLALVVVLRLAVLLRQIVFPALDLPHALLHLRTLLPGKIAAP